MSPEFSQGEVPLEVGGVVFVDDEAGNTILHLTEGSNGEMIQGAGLQVQSGVPS
jgi:hypothetical protein